MTRPLVIDTHGHYWREPPAGATRLGAHHDPIEVDEFIRHMDEAGIDKLVQITRGMMGFDNGYSLEGAAKYPHRIRVMGRFDAGALDMPGRLRAWMAQPYTVGVRVMTIFPDEAKRFADGSMDAFWPEAERQNVPVAIYAPNQASMLDGIAERHPGLRLIVDHIGMNVVRIFESTPSDADWPNLLRLARRPNVYVKVSGMPEAMVERYPFPKAQAKLRELYNAFGPDRLLWGSNFPPTKQVCTYREAADLVRELCPFLGAEDRAKIMGRTAATALGLPW